MLYIVMLVFQLAGALILIINEVIGSKKRIIANCFPGSNVVKREDDENVLIEKELLQKSAKQIYLNIAAFADLFIGYVAAAFSPMALDNKSVTVFSVIVGSMVIVFVEFIAIRLITKKRYSKYEVVPYEFLEKMGVDTIITDREIDEIFSNHK